ncbi:1-acyl-sn-glycerol-3-phosphate acyltransferase [Aeromicrobium sp. YIM 150415]|uniref:lysophospholipid acyltransferase family protein n=1 Tax=Aeromicrobium sp. YIM 150415 TaxID=2803912 RepID=UPI0019635551|nr:lysophospholipid acyltransferase family protein [Aeromicrobium sp. YIM 150415]MBM9462027.1 1-acyl-sn-glycerol-3-phosphate acyltransferase [Aeromicrobium sp. YIM 150415]
MRDITYPPIILTAKTLFKLLGMRFQMSGTEHIPREGGAILAANHIGYVDFIFDGLAAQPSKRLVRFMAKKEAFEHAVSGPVMRSLHHIPVDRDSGEASFRDAVEYARSGEIVGIFPEATISRSMEIKDLKTGAVRIAAEAGVPLIPMVTWGTQLLKTKDHDSDLFGRGKTIALHVGEPLQVTGEDPVAETERLRVAMSALLDKAITEYPVSPQGQWWAPARYGGLAPTPEEAERLDAEEKAARAARRAAREDD